MGVSSYWRTARTVRTTSKTALTISVTQSIELVRTAKLRPVRSATRQGCIPPSFLSAITSVATFDKATQIYTLLATQPACLLLGWSIIDREMIAARGHSGIARCEAILLGGANIGKMLVKLT
jgi:hypothetical protein